MPDKLDEILVEVKELKHWLYGANGHEGDIPQIKKQLSNHHRKIRILELIVVGLVVSGGGALGISQLLGG